MWKVENHCNKGLYLSETLWVLVMPPLNLKSANYKGQVIIAQILSIKIPVAE